MLRGQAHGVQVLCVPAPKTMTADSTRSVECQGDGNGGFYSLLGGFHAAALLSLGYLRVWTVTLLLL